MVIHQKLEPWPTDTMGTRGDAYHFLACRYEFVSEATILPFNLHSAQNAVATHCRHLDPNV